MSSELAQRVSQYIVRVISESPQQSASGTRIASSVHALFPEFNVQSEGCRSLRDFIRNFVPQLSESPERAGMDVVYLLKIPRKIESAAEVPPSRVLPSHQGFVSLLLKNPRAWKTFASPLSSSRIFVDPVGSTIHVSSLHSAPTGSNWLRVDPISATSLLQIAKDFTDQVPELYRPALTESLSRPKWWLAYFEVTGSLGLKSKWVSFRRRRILDEFVNVVTSRAAEAVNPSTDSSKAQVVAETVALGGALVTPTPLIAGVPEERLRALVVAVVNRMTPLELRSLTLPLGYVLDSLKIGS